MSEKVAVAFRLSMEERNKLKDIARSAEKTQSKLFRWWINKTHEAMFPNGARNGARNGGKTI